MSLYRAQVIHKHVSGLPRDHFTNTFWFVEDDPVAGTPEAIAESVRDFYITLLSPYTSSISSMFSDAVAVANHEIRMSEINVVTGANVDGDGAPPIHTEVFDHLGRTPSANPGGLPSEVAICLSYRNEDAPGVPLNRRRGRVFLGPWGLSALAEESGTQRPFIHSTLRTQLVGTAARLLAAQPWVIYSRPFAGRVGAVKDNGDPKPDLAPRIGSTYPIQRFWVDDAWDTQRKRGERPVARTYSA